MESETSRWFPCIRQDNEQRRRYKFTGKMGSKLETPVLVVRVFGTRKKFLTLCELKILK